MILPGPLGGSDPLVRWLNQLRDVVQAWRISRVIGGHVEGNTIVIDDWRGGKMPRLMRLKSVTDDYVVCRTWDGTNESSGDIAVAKPKKLRCSLTSESKYGTTHYYTYAAGPDSDNEQRTDKWPDEAGTGGSEDQLVTPPWTLNEEIEVYPGETTAVDGDSAPIHWRMSAPWRQWAKISA